MAAKEKKTSLGEFVNQVKTETSKVVWPDRQQTIQTAIMVFIMMTLLALFFLGTDWVFNWIVRSLLALA